jgi:hypothetical protein
VSRENVEMVKRGRDVYNRRDVGALASSSTRDLYPVLPGAVEGGSYQGREGVEKYFSESTDARDSRSSVSSFAISATECSPSVACVDATKVVAAALALCSKRRASRPATRELLPRTVAVA